MRAALRDDTFGNDGGLLLWIRARVCVLIGLCPQSERLRSRANTQHNTHSGVTPNGIGVVATFSIEQKRTEPLGVRSRQQQASPLVPSPRPGPEIPHHNFFGFVHTSQTREKLVGFVPASTTRLDRIAWHGMACGERSKAGHKWCCPKPTPPAND